MKRTALCWIVRRIIVTCVFAVNCGANISYAKGTTEPSVLITKSLLQMVQKSRGDINTLQRWHVLQLPPEVRFQSDSANLSKPPDTKLRYDIQRAATSDPPEIVRLTLVWMPTVNIGGVYAIEGSHNCKTWTMFNADKTNTHSIPAPAIFEPEICTRDGQDAYFGIFKHHAVAISTLFIDQPSGAKLDVDAQNWDGTKWTAQESVTIPLSKPYTAK